MLNVLSVYSKYCGSPIASGRNAIRRLDCESTHFAALRQDQRELHEEAGRQKRSEDEALRKTFIDTGISEPFE
jgi:hypothetical protein